MLFPEDFIKKVTHMYEEEVPYMMQNRAEDMLAEEFGFKNDDGRCDNCDDEYEYGYETGKNDRSEELVETVNDLESKIYKADNKIRKLDSLRVKLKVELRKQRARNKRLADNLEAKRVRVHLNLRRTIHVKDQTLLVSASPNNNIYSNANGNSYQGVPHKEHQES